MKAGLRLPRNRQQLTVAPEIFGPRLDLGSRQLDRRVVVHRLERSQALAADVCGFGRKDGLTQMALQSDQRAHTASANVLSDNPVISFASTTAGAGTSAARSRAIACTS